MRKRPWPIVVLALLHFLSPIGNFFFNAQYIPVSHWTYFKAHFSSVNLWSSLFFFTVPPLAGLAIYACKRWSFWAYIFLMILILGGSFYGWQTRPEIKSVMPLVLLFSVNVGVVGYFLIPAVRTLYFDPRLRWWETKPRYAVDYEADVVFDDKKNSGKILNISESGLFLRMNGGLPQDGVRIEVSFQDEDNHFTAVGTTILHRRQDELGIGVKFIHTSGSTRSLKFLIKRLQSKGKLISPAATGPEDSFMNWFKKAIKTGEGFIPKIEKKKQS